MPAAQPEGSAAARDLPAALLPTHYQLLQLGPQASTTELRAAFRRLSKQVHPDTTSLPAEQAQDQFRRLQLAYATLSDPEQRRRYDAELLRARLSRPEPPLPPVGTPLQTLQTPTSVRRALSGGEWFALLLLALAMLFSLVLGLGMAWSRGRALIERPSWWPPDPPRQTAEAPQPAHADGRPAFPPDPPLPPSPAEPGGLAGQPGRPAAS